MQSAIKHAGFCQWCVLECGNEQKADIKDLDDKASYSKNKTA